MAFDDDTIRVVARWTASNEEAQMGQHFAYVNGGGGISATQRAAIAAAYSLWWTAGHPGASGNQRQWHPNFVTLAEVVITDYITPATPPITYHSALGLAGTGGTQSQPAEVSAVLSKRTATGGPNARGRAYLPWLIGNSNLASSFSMAAGLANTWALNYAALLTALNASAGADVTAVVASSAQGTNYPITSIQVGDQWDTQRRRGDNLAETYSTVAV